MKEVGGRSRRTLWPQYRCHPERNGTGGSRQRSRMVLPTLLKRTLMNHQLDVEFEGEDRKLG